MKKNMLDFLSELDVYKKIKEKIKHNLEYKKINSGLFKKNPDNLVYQVFSETIYQLEAYGYIVNAKPQQTYKITKKDGDSYKKLKLIK